MRIFLDANNLFSAARSDGAIRRLLELLQERGHELWVDGFVVEEARRNLAARQAESVAALETLLASLQAAGLQAIDPELTASWPLPDKDRPVLAAALRCRCEVLLTGDRTHFGPFYGSLLLGVTIHSPRSLAEEILGPERDRPPAR